MSRWAAINYRDFWDFPHIFICTDGGRTYLFDCPFDEELGDFLNEFHLYLMPTLPAEVLAGSWAGLHHRAVASLGSIPTSSVKFDPTKRQFVDASVLDTLSTTAARAPG